MERVYNFSAGPATLPQEVLEKASKEMLCYRDSGMSVMEMSHRSSHFQNIIDSAESSLRELMNIPSNYKVLFLQGGASTQFAMIPMNLFNGSKKADFVTTGAWSKKAITESKRYGEVNVLASSEDKTFTYIPELNKADFNPDADFFYITLNNTIYGTRYTTLPEVGNVPLIADASSNFLSEEMDINKFGMVFAGAQKNVGPAGVTIVIIREDLIGNPLDITPTMLNYETHSSKGSLFNTPPTYSIYVAGMVFDWVKAQGGVKAIEAMNIEKANLLYNYLDESDFFNGTVVKKDRSLMNAPFLSPSDELNAKFVKEAAAQGMVNLKGHRTVGGMRASIYNAMPKAGVEKLVEFMKKFELENK